MKQINNMNKREELDAVRNFIEYLTSNDQLRNQLFTVLSEYEETLEGEDIQYPFNEGDRYYTIEGDIVVESIWDCQSEEMYDNEICGPLFSTKNEARLHYKSHKLRETLHNVIELMIDQQNPSLGIQLFLATYNDSASEPKYSLI
jgi:hypothetical protein